MSSTVQNDPELDAKVKKATERISENMHIVANEPSLAFYRLQEHVRKALPPMVDKRLEVSKLHHDLQGHCYDVEYAISAVKSMENAGKTFMDIQDLLRNAIFLRQQLKYEESRRLFMAYYSATIQQFYNKIKSIDSVNKNLLQLGPWIESSIYCTFTVYPGKYIRTTYTFSYEVLILQVQS